MVLCGIFNLVFVVLSLGTVRKPQYICLTLVSWKRLPELQLMSILELGKLIARTCLMTDYGLYKIVICEYVNMEQNWPAWILLIACNFGRSKFSNEMLLGNFFCLMTGTLLVCTYLYVDISGWRMVAASTRIFSSHHFCLKLKCMFFLTLQIMVGY